MESVNIVKKKSDMAAQNAYQYARLEKAGFYFVNCSVEEREEELCFSYQTEEMQPLTERRKEKNRAWKYGMICQLLEAVRHTEDYTFSCHPDNLYCDTYGRIKIMERDIGRQEEEILLKKVLSFAGFLLQKKYDYEDYLQGGLSLLGEQRTTRGLADIKTLEEAYAVFRKLYEKERKLWEKNYIWCRRRRKTTESVVMCLALAAAFFLLGIHMYQYQTAVLPQRHALAAERASLEQDPVQTIEAMEAVPVEKMDRHEKYLVAAAYINGQVVDSFTNETKELLLSRMAYNSEELLLDYWIYLGRGETDQAIDIAMRKSDNQLLLYGYLQKLDRVSEDMELTGAEKENQLSELKGKIKSLADNMGIQYGEQKTGGE